MQGREDKGHCRSVARKGPRQDLNPELARGEIHTLFLKLNRTVRCTFGTRSGISPPRSSEPLKAFDSEALKEKPYLFTHFLWHLCPSPWAMQGLNVPLMGEGYLWYKKKEKCLL